MTISTTTSQNSLLASFSERPVSAIAIGIAGLGSASLNTWGASQIFPNPFTAVIFGMVIAACEVIAFLTLRHIVADWGNHRYWKAASASIIMLFAVTGCILSGKQAFHVLSLEANANHASLVTRHAARKAEADTYHKQMLAGELDLEPRVAQARWETKQDRADEANIAALKAAPPSEMIVTILLALFEMVKIGGLWAIATATTKGQTIAQRRAAKRRTEIADKQSALKHAARMADLDDEMDNVIAMNG